jgi:hypothetical protein
MANTTDPLAASIHGTNPQVRQSQPRIGWVGFSFADPAAACCVRVHDDGDGAFGSPASYVASIVSMRPVLATRVARSPTRVSLSQPLSPSLPAAR